MVDVDDALIRALQQDGRRSYSGLARDLGLSRNQVSARVRTMLAQGRIRIVAAADPGLLGERVMAHVAVVGAGPSSAVVQALCARDDVPLVSAVTGGHDLIAEIRTSDLGSLQEALDWLRRFPEVAALDVALYVEVSSGVFIAEHSAARRIDEVDVRLIEQLRHDGRASCRHLARTVMLSESAVRGRLERLTSSGVVRIGAVVAHDAESRRTKIGLGITLCGDGEQVVAALRRCPELEFAARTVGRFDLVATLNSAEAATLVTRIEELTALPQVARMETWHHLQTWKEDYALSLSRERALRG